MTPGIMFKTVSGDCNLNCSYCYYGQYREHFGPGSHRISPAMLERFMASYLEQADGAGSFVWQGGEPMLAGLEWFRQVVELEARCARPGTLLSNAIQTNGTLLSDEWADFFRQYSFLVGVSLDGPAGIHDANRTGGRNRQGSFARVMQGISHLRRHGVEFTILCVVSPANVRRGGDVLRFFREEGFDSIQFIPCMDMQAFDPHQPARYLITAGEYGQFLCESFDAWYGSGMPMFSVRLFDNILAQMLGEPPNCCTFRRRCEDMLVVEQNGDVFPCDFYIHPDWRLGNIAEQSFADLVSHPAFRAFAARKTQLPARCRQCSYRTLCLGGCPRNRAGASGIFTGEDYFCAAYLRLFDYAGLRLRGLAHLLARKRARTAGPERNAPCPCGSGRKFKHCCMSQPAQ